MARPGQRKLIFAATALLVGLAVAVGLRTSEVALLPPLPPAVLEVELEHPLRSGLLKVWVDDALVAEEPLESRVKEDLVVVKLRVGRARKTVEVQPGERQVRLEVTGDGFTATRSIDGRFDSRSTRRLRARVSGLLSRELRVWWGS